MPSIKPKQSIREQNKQFFLLLLWIFILCVVSVIEVSTMPLGEVTQSHDIVLHYISDHVYIQNNTIYFNKPVVIATQLDTLIYIWRNK